ncbi:DNA helicase UvrD [Candidatus Woesearchaeota archaeon]|nr:DNA helicase UvrD [Candidatus Woesearchaeota archaeon]
MKLIADLQIHSRFSRATSSSITIANLEKYARLKGINLLGTGDFTHPKWLEELKSELKEDGSGILTSKSNFKFVLQGEISNIYKQGIDDDIEIIPAHAWTPWYGIFGSMSGFDSVEECFKEYSHKIHAIETGLSSDPGMNWRLSKLDKYTLLSSSDAHSFWPWRLGREANVFDIELSYGDLLNAIRKRKGFAETIEMWPHEGKYHYTGHRACDVCLSPKESLKIKNTCPKCRRPLTIGVAQRVEQLADREEGFVPRNAVPFKNLIPLSEVIAGTTGNAVSSKQVWEEYYKLVNEFGNEFNVLLEAEENKLKKTTTGKIVENILKNRFQKIPFKPGYDGVYGVPIFDEKEEFKEEIKPKIKQSGLDEFI